MIRMRWPWGRSSLSLPPKYHGINMDKGFNFSAEEQNKSFEQALETMADSIKDWREQDEKT